MSGQLILLVERSSVEASTYAGHLDKAGLRVVVVETAADALQMLAVETVSLIVLDCKLPETDGVGFLTVLRERQCGLPVLILTGNASLNAAVQSMRAGACDYLVKPFRGDRLVDAVRAALSGAQRVVVTDAQHEDDETRGFRGFTGTSAAMQAVYHSVRTAATSKATIFISGESGTGKEVCAEAIHL
ncbi:MAG: response regulator, partial [Geminicoccaceae bacterium]